MRRIVLLCLFSMIFISEAWAQVNVGENSTLSGRIYSDYYWVISNHNESLEGENGFWFRRIYFTFDHELNESFSTRLRLEMDSEGDFMSDSKMSPVVKDAYLKWENDQHEIYAGISSTPVFSLVEDMWGYRAVEKSPLDLQGLASSRDFGLAAKGTLGSDERWKYHAMVGNGNSNGSEINSGKKVMASLSYQLSDNLIVEVYGDRNELPGDIEWTTLQGFIGFEQNDFSVGFLYAQQNRNIPQLAGTGSYTLDIASLYARTSLNSGTAGFIRIDHMFDPNPEGEDISYLPFSSEANSTLLIGGLDFTLEENIHLIPNVEAVFYGQTPQGTTPRSDLIPRLTLFYQF